uniref:C3H1-type domain-containing protein n=1 Tax=Plectus sambesii TaxID=2011161 RepID=A0A914VGX5_9BILA
MFFSADRSMTMMPLSQPPPVLPSFPAHFQQPAQQPSMGGYWVYCPAPVGGQEALLTANSVSADMLRRNHAREGKRALMYKTVLCKQFADTGRCNYGDGCQYAHGDEDRRAPPPRHPKFRTEPCKNFERLGVCPYGSRCHFIHPDESGYASSNPTTSPMSVELPTDLSSNSYGSTIGASSPMQPCDFKSSNGPSCFWPSISSLANVADAERFFAMSNYQYFAN